MKDVPRESPVLLVPFQEVQDGLSSPAQDNSVPLPEIDSGVPFVRIETLGEALDPEIEPWRLGAAAFTSFGLIAIALAMVGLWSSVSYAVSQRRHEFAVRLAVGASRRALVRLVLDEGIRNAAVAIAAGVVISIVAGRFIADLLFGVSPRDPLIFASIATGVLTVSLLSSLIPARRAWRIHPAEVLRNE